MANQTSVVQINGKLNTTNDTYPGGGDASPGLVPAMVGAEIQLSGADAAKLSDTTVATLRSGRYKYVQFKSGSSASNARGQLVFYLNSADYEAGIVTPDGAAVKDGLCAGVTLNAVSKGSYGWIQIGGNADVKFKSSVTDTTIGNQVVVDTTANVADSLADATANATAGVSKRVIGVSLAASANSTISAVLLKGLPSSEVN